MQNILVLGDYSYSSWSLRGWLLFDRWGIDVSTRMIDFFEDASVGARLADLPPARTVPTWVTPEGTVIWDSLAIAEELASRFPDRGYWPADPAARAVARSLSAEMHSGFTTLRSDCPMNLRVAYRDVPVSDALAADLARLETIWSFARGRFGVDGPWLCGDYSIADAFYAPVAARTAGYGLPVSETAQAYVDAHLSDPSFVKWRAMGLAEGADLPWYAKDFPQVAWPGPSGD
ncbi:glutathione S-transferase [Litorisediminicola beolgyonensis]|uniref:Glutathione S-transferase n=1 Tax=Litorisediminicola beolgyonensis TaxID=1173614 RepID=A0ABW3ZFR3_9RHOB